MNDSVTAGLVMVMTVVKKYDDYETGKFGWMKGKPCLVKSRPFYSGLNETADGDLHVIIGSYRFYVYFLSYKTRFLG